MPRFESFTEGARQAVVQAQEIARDLNHSHVGTEHLLLGLLSDKDEIPTQVLGSLRIDREKVLGRVLETVGRGDDPHDGTLPFTPRAKKALELGLRQSLAFGQRDITTAHLLLGLIRDRDGLAARVLLDLNVSLRTLRDEVLEQLDAANPGQRSTRRSGPVAAPKSASNSSATCDTFAASPDAQLRELLKATGMQAAAEARREFGFADLLAAATRLPDMRKLLDSSFPGRGGSNA